MRSHSAAVNGAVIPMAVRPFSSGTIQSHRKLAAHAIYRLSSTKTIPVHVAHASTHGHVRRGWVLTKCVTSTGTRMNAGQSLSAASVNAPVSQATVRDVGARWNCRYAKTVSRANN